VRASGGTRAPIGVIPRVVAALLSAPQTAYAPTDAPGGSCVTPLGERSEWSAETARILVETARRLGQTLDPYEIYRCFHEVLGETVPHDGLLVSSYDRDANLISCDFAWADGVELDPTTLPPLTPNPEGAGMQSRVIMSGEPLLVNDVAERVSSGKGTFYNVDAEGNVQKVPESGAVDTRAAIMVPVKHEGEVVGVVQVMSDRRAYDPEHLDLVEALVALVAGAVRNARLNQERLRFEAAAEAARAVAAEREQAARVLAAVGEGIVLVDEEGVVRLVNPEAARIAGSPAAEVLGRRIGDVFTGWEALEEHRGAVGGHSARQSVPLTVGERELWLSVVAVRSADGVVYALRDETTERSLDRAKSDFVATVSHELRTPLASIYGAAVTLQRREALLDEEQRGELLSIVTREAERLGELVDEILLTAQIEAGRIRLNEEPVDLAEAAEAAVAAARPRADGHDLAVRAADAIPPVVADAPKLRQVLVNLVDNAIKYTPGGTRIVVDVAAEGGRVFARVHDQGAGIPADEQGRIFEKFYRLDPDQTSGVSGTGLGLYISRELVERMGGELTVSSREGEGSIFAIALPAAPAGQRAGARD
jgi:two-component system phosphate regulon sensor histidine kinase PhoR